VTSLVALATKDGIVLGCDSLGTSLKELIDPFELIEFFDRNKKGWPLRKDKDGNPLFKNYWSLLDKARPVPYTHMTHMNKIFDLTALEMGIMTAGIASLGDSTIGSLIEELKRRNPALKKRRSIENTVKRVAEAIRDSIGERYDKEHPNTGSQPPLEFLLAGYDSNNSQPKIVRITFPRKTIALEFEKPPFGIAFAGQMKEIQRLVFGTDSENMQKIRDRHIELLRKYRQRVNEWLKKKAPSPIEIPEIGKKEIDKLDMFGEQWKLNRFGANWGDFSEQNAIECVDFFVNIMIKSQQFGEGMPTVGPPMHIALITKEKGFRFVSREEYEHAGHFLQR